MFGCVIGVMELLEKRCSRKRDASFLANVIIKKDVNNNIEISNKS
jgi:hypothetical protein